MHVINIVHKCDNICTYKYWLFSVYLLTYLAPQISHECSAKAFPVTVSSNDVTMDLSLLLCSSGTYVCV